jgi:hypothetical protein
VKGAHGTSHSGWQIPWRLLRHVVLSVTRSRCLHSQLHSASDVAPSRAVATPRGHLVQLPLEPKPAFHSPWGQGATWPGVFKKYPSGTTAGAAGAALDLLICSRMCSAHGKQQLWLRLSFCQSQKPKRKGHELAEKHCRQVCLISSPQAESDVEPVLPCVTSPLGHGTQARCLRRPGEYELAEHFTAATAPVAESTA